MAHPGEPSRRRSGTNLNYLKNHGRFPATLSLVAVVLFATWMASAYGGFFVTNWTPPALVLAVLLLFGCATGVLRGARSFSTSLALTLLVAYTAWSFASMLWAPNRGDAWVGAGQTLLYLLSFCMAVGLLSAGASRRWVLAASAIGPAILAALTLRSLLRDPESFFEGGRLIGTIGYYNGEAAFLLIPFWVALYVASSRRVHPAVRGVVLAGATLSLNVAVLTQSRGAVVALAVSLLLFFLLSGQRLRGLLALAPVVITLLITFPSLNEVYVTLLDQRDPVAALDRIAWIAWLSAVSTGLYGILWGFVDRRWRPSVGMGRVVGSLVLAGAVIFAGVGVVKVVERVGDPVAAVQQKWEAFKTNDTTRQEQSRYLSASSQGRYTLWQVALEDFSTHPILGVGTYNFEATYYQLRNQSVGTVRTVHSLPLEVLSERGIVGGVLFFGFVATCVVASLRQRFGRLTSEGKAQVGALVAAAAYWFIHSSAEYFWQIPAITLPAMIYLAMLVTPWRRSETLTLGWPLRLSGSTLALVAIVSIVPLYVADRYLVQTYATQDPAESLALIERAQQFNPVNPLLPRREAEIAIQDGNFMRAEEAYQEAIRLNPNNYATYVLLATLYDRRADPVNALPLYQQALSLNPLDADLGRETVRLAAQVPAESRTVRFMVGNTERGRLDLKVVDNASEGESNTQVISKLPPGFDGVLSIRPNNTKAPLSGRAADGPLDIALVSINGQIVAIRSIASSEEVSIRPAQSYRFVIETDHGFFRRNAIKPGSRIVTSS